VSERVQPGACRCGAVRFEVHGTPLATFACHCTGCQKMTGGAYSLSSLYPRERFEVTQGDTVLGGMKGANKHHFCGSCLSWIYSVPEGFDAFANVRSSMLDNAAEHRPFVDMFISEALPGASSGAPKRYETGPEEQEFGALMSAYAEWDGRVKE
jgi:hypothetical protein